MLPARPGWIRDVAYLGDQVLEYLATAAATNAHHDDNRYLLLTAGLTIEALAEAVPEGGAGQAVVYIPCPPGAWRHCGRSCWYCVGPRPAIRAQTR
ncbi:hypothetical protein [Kitasatospora sp. NPDC054795]